MSYFANVNGTPRLEAESVTVGTASAVYNFNLDRRVRIPDWYSGAIWFKLPAFTAPATAVPVVFNIANASIPLTTIGGTPVTTANLNQAGIILTYYENGTLQLQTVLTL